MLLTFHFIIKLLNSSDLYYIKLYLMLLLNRYKLSPLSILINLALLISFTSSAIVFEKSTYFAAIQLQFTTSNGLISDATVKTFSIINQGYQNISNLGLALCGYDMPRPTSMQYRADASFNVQQNLFVVTIFPINQTQFAFINYYLLIVTAEATSYLYVQNTCLKPTYNFTNPALFNTIQTYTVASPYTLNSTNKITAIPYLRSLNNIVTNTFNFFNCTSVAILRGTASINISILVNFGFQSEVCFSILFYHNTEAELNKFMNANYSENFLPIDSDILAQTLGSRSQQAFTMNSIYGPNYNYKCVIGFQSFKMIAANRQTLSFNMTGTAVYGLISSGNYQLSYAWFCLTVIQCQGTNTQYYPYSNNCQQVCNITNCTFCQTSTSCRTCDPQYFINQLYTCSRCLSNCLNCSNSTNCFSCVEGTYYNGTNCLTCFQNCLNCSSSMCSKCMSGFIANGRNCQQCSQTLPQCLQCASTNICTSCPYGFYNTFSSGCIPCGNVLGGCKACGSQYVCVQCNRGFYLQWAKCLTCTFSIQLCCPFYVENCLTCRSDKICSRCSGGNFLANNNQSCTSCKLFLLNCSLCSNQTLCQACESGFYINNLTSCTPCGLTIDNCLSCDNSTFCKKCNTGYLTINGSCYNCTIWPLNNLFYLDSNRNCLSCGLVTTYCIKCTTSQCIQCSSISFLSNARCLLCQTLITNCISCISISNCSFCKVGYYADSQNNSQCSSCQASIENCMSCFQIQDLVRNTYNLSCTICRPQYYTNNSKCSPCLGTLPFCLTCINSYQCNSCQNTYFLTSILTCVACNQIILGCLECSSSSACLKCSEGYYAINNYCTLCSVGLNNCFACGLFNNTLICSTCLQGSFISFNSSCISCNQTIQYCTACSSSSACIKCLPGYIVNFNKTCSPCKHLISNCQYCTNRCLKCFEGYLINNLALCISCSSLSQGCGICTQETVGSRIGLINCTSCLPDYLFFRANNISRCVLCNSSILNCINCFNLTTCSQCQPSYFLNPQKQCSLCSIYLPNCINCSGSSVCLACSDKFYLTQSYTCQTCDTSLFGTDGTPVNRQLCQYCEYKSKIAVCLSCISGYYMSSNKCIPCSTISNCVECSSISICISCKPGFYLSLNNNLCIQCPATLTYCYRCNSIGICLQCISQSYMSRTLNRCILCSSVISGCRSCIENACTSCLDGYYQEGSSCISCSSSIANCALCNNQKDCLLFSNANEVKKTSQSSFINDFSHSLWLYLAIAALVVFLITLIIFLVRLFCCGKKKKEPEQKTTQNLTKFHTERQLTSEQNPVHNKVQIRETEHCHSCKNNSIDVMNVQILCNQCEKIQGRGNNHIIRKAINNIKDNRHQLQEKLMNVEEREENKRKSGKMDSKS